MLYSQASKSNHRHIVVALLFFLSSENANSQQQQTPVVASESTKVRTLIPNLPPNHYQFWLKNHPRALQDFERICSQAPRPLELTEPHHFNSLHVNLSMEDPLYLSNFDYGKSILNAICSKIDLISKSCWGYENNCQIIHLMPECVSSSADEQERKIAWFSQADFGYILERRKEMSKFCSPDKHSNDSVKSSLECTKHFRTCRGDNLFMKFDQDTSNGSLVNNDIIGPVQMGGCNCDLQRLRIKEEDPKISPVRSWFTELKDYDLVSGLDSSEGCDIRIDKQTFIVRLNSTSSMYHYFENFLNLYATIHLNNKFSDDNQIVIWDRKAPKSSFDLMWSAFSRNQILSLDEFEGKRVCLKNFIFALSPSQYDGLYYNAAQVPECHKTGLFDAFNKHVIHKLKVRQKYKPDRFYETGNDSIRVTLLSRSKNHRRIVNEKELELALQNKKSDYEISLVDMTSLNFAEQIEIAQNTDVLVGIHGSDLTHSLFLPDWAALVELYDCNDKSYNSLARLRGVSYFSLPHNSTQRQRVENSQNILGPNKSNINDRDKLFNYSIDINQFIITMELASKRVRQDRSEYFKNYDEAKTKLKIGDPNERLGESKEKSKEASNDRTEL